MSNSNTQTELKSARLRALISVFVNLFLTVIKGIAGIFANSTALLSDAIHSGTDVVASLAAYLGLLVASRKHPSFPYGLFKAETVASLVASIAIFLAAYEIGRQAIFGINKIPDVKIAIPVAAFCLIISTAFGLFQKREGKRLHSIALEADGRDYLADSLSTGIVLIGLIASSFGWAVDQWAAGIVSIFVFKSGGEVFVRAIKDLLDASIDRETERNIIKVIEDNHYVTRVDKCLSRSAGGRIIIDMDVIMRTPSHELADRIADEMEMQLPEKFSKIIMARIRPHFESKEIITQISPVDAIEGKPVSHLGSAPYFLVKTINKKTKQTTKEFIQNPFSQEKKKKGLRVGNFLLSLKPDKIILHPKTNQDSAAIIILKEAGIKIVFDNKK